MEKGDGERRWGISRIEKKRGEGYRSGGEWEGGGRTGGGEEVGGGGMKEEEGGLRGRKEKVSDKRFKSPLYFIMLWKKVSAN